MSILVVVVESLWERGEESLFKKGPPKRKRDK